MYVLPSKFTYLFLLGMFLIFKQANVMFAAQQESSTDVSSSYLIVVDGLHTNNQTSDDHDTEDKISNEESEDNDESDSDSDNPSSPNSSNKGIQYPLESLGFPMRRDRCCDKIFRHYLLYCKMNYPWLFNCFKKKSKSPRK